MSNPVADLESMTSEATRALEAFSENDKHLEGSLDEMRSEYERALADAGEPGETGDLECVKQEVEQIQAALESLQSHLQSTLDSASDYVSRCENMADEIEQAMDEQSEESMDW